MPIAGDISTWFRNSKTDTSSLSYASAVAEAAVISGARIINEHGGWPVLVGASGVA